MDNLILKGIIDGLYEGMVTDPIKKIHVSFLVVGSELEFIPEGLAVSNEGILTLNITPRSIGGVFYNDENNTVTIQLAVNGKRTEVTLISSLLCAITLFYMDGSTKSRPMQPILRIEYDQIQQFDTKVEEVSEVLEKRSKMRVLS